jgi:transitional endoplasmic reticulum ATPase
MEVRVVFRRSGSREFSGALAFAERQPGFREEPAAGEYSVGFTQDQLDGYEELMAQVGRWQHTRVLLNGQAVPRAGLDRLLGCYRARLRAPDRRAYCCGAQVHESRVGPARQLFPCRLIPISEGNEDGWFHHGRLTRDGVFVVDKGALRQSVASALEGSLASHCPALFPAEVDAVVDRLPDRIDPTRDPRWVYREGWHEGRFVRVGVEKRVDDAPLAGERTGAPAGAAAWAPRPAPAAAPERGPAADPRPPAPGGAAAAGAIALVRYADIGGLDAEIRVVRENVELPLRFPDLFARLGIEPHRGILLWGPPGTGKTLLARALATECEASLLTINGPEILSKWRGDSEANLRRIFEEARASAPSVVLVDELDAIAPDRARVQHNHEAVLVSQLLTLLDGLVDRGRVVVVATTNRPELVDPAVRRPGRLDLLLEIGLPDESARADILRIHTRRMPLGATVDIGALAAATAGFTGAQLGALCREAGLECMRGVVGLDASGAFVLPDGALERLEVTPEHFRRALAVVGRSPAAP